MDKRWIYILIIMIIGIACLFLIVETSTTIGKATVKVNGSIITIPDSFNIDSTGGSYARLINRNTQEAIYVQDLGKGNVIEGNMTERLESMQNNGEYINVENVTLYNDTVPSITYEDANDTYNQISYVAKHNHTYYLRSSHFFDKNVMQEDMQFIIDSIILNYKQKQD